MINSDKMRINFTKLSFIIGFFFSALNSNAQNSILVNFGSNACGVTNVPSFSFVNNPLGASSVISSCDMSSELPDYFSVFIAYNPKDGKIYICDTRTGVSRVWQLDMGLPADITCPTIPVDPTYTYPYLPNNFEFDNNGDLWSFHDYNDTTGVAVLDRFDVTTGNVFSSTTLQFPVGNFPNTLSSGDVTILPNGRMFVVFGDGPSQLYEVLNYNGAGGATAVYLQTLPLNTFGLAYLNGKLEITGTDHFFTCYYYTYDIFHNTLSDAIPFQNGLAPIDNTSITPAIGSTKQLVNAVKVDNTTYDLTYEIYVRNMGNVVLNNINATDDLGAAFGAANISNVSVSFEPGSNNAGLTLNNAYNGTTDINILNPGQNLNNQILSNTDYYFAVEVKCRVTNLFIDKIYYNSAIGTATIGSGAGIVNVSDSSNNGPAENVDPNANGNAGDTGENVPTPFNEELPVHFTNLNASWSNAGSALINWTVATPTVEAGKFEVQYSTDGATWQTLKQVNVSNASQANYQCDQQNISAAAIYYRIKEIDNNGFYSYSKIVLLKNKNNSNNNYVVFPNPAHNYIQVSAPYEVKGDYHIDLFDAVGRKVFGNTITTSTTELNTSKLPAGTYMLQIKHNDDVSTQKVLIMH